MSASAKFPSGEWVGFYVYSGRTKRFLMDLILTFSDGRMSGEGCDGIGSFHIEGDYSETTMECSWVKKYLGRHSVEYSGCKEGKHIWGTWSLPDTRGGFQIWPIGSEPNLDGITAEEDMELSETAEEIVKTPATI